MRLPTSCPKCQHERKAGEDACARCGLLVARWDGFREQVPSVPAIDEAWAALEGDWQDDEAHRRFLEIAAGCDGLDVAAARYRQARALRPEDGRAQAGIERAVGLAVNLYVGRTLASRASGPPGWVKAAKGLGVTALLLAAFYLLYFVLRPSW